MQNNFFFNLVKNNSLLFYNITNLGWYKKYEDTKEVYQSISPNYS